MKTISKIKLVKIIYLHVLVVILCLVVIQIKAQQLIYATIEDNNLFVGYRESENRVDLVKAFSLEAPFYKKITYTPVLLNSNLPFKWCIADSNIVVAYGFGRIPSRGKTLIETFPIEYKDSLTALNLKIKLIDSLAQIYGSENKAIAKLGLDRRSTANIQQFQPLFNLYESIYFNPNSKRDDYQITYDFNFEKNGEFSFFIRGNDLFEVWTYDYLDRNDKRKIGWLKNVSYLPDMVIHWNSFGDKDTTYVLTENEPLVFDSLFFEGHFEVIKQIGNTFLINLKNGSIYYLGEKGVHLIGQVIVDNYPHWILGRPLIIEDQNQSRVILFGKVEQFDTKFPFPNIQLYSSEEEVPKYLRNLE